MARPERFELPTFWFVGRSSKTSKCRYWYRLRAKRATYSALKLDGSWTENQFQALRLFLTRREEAMLGAFQVR